jgi:hypothetical protein
MRWIVLLVMVGVPRVCMAGDLGPLEPLRPIGMALVAAAFLFGAGALAWRFLHLLGAYRNRDRDGMGPVFEEIAFILIITIVGTVVISGGVSQLTAAAATP